MKKIIIAFILCFVSIGVSAQYSIGDYVQLVKGITGWYQDKIAIAVMNVNDKEIPIMVLCSHSSLDYDVFNEESRILIKFDDDTKMTLHRVPDDETIKDYDNAVYNGILYHHYYTFTHYIIEKEFLLKILQNGITKVRVVKANGNANEYDIKESYQKTLTEKLKDSYIAARKENKQKEKNMNDEDF